MSGPAPEPPETRILPLSDGRQVGYVCYGAERGRSVFYCHGLPGSRYECLLVDTPARALGINVIAPDRPGYGLTSPDHGHALKHWAQDIAHLADRLGIDTFDVIGVSGGAPCALACAHELPQRVSSVALVAGLGPVCETSLRHDMSGFARLAFYLGNRFPRLFATAVGWPTVQLSRRRPDLLIRLLAALGGMPDKAVLLDPRIFPAFTFSIRECFRQGVLGGLQDLRLFRQPWGFRLEHIRQPVRIWHGTQDRVVPLSHSEYLAAHLPRAQLAIVADEGHFSLPLRHLREILQSFIA
jgi:pimeloyl-ACP methyl ester carboxylesterase